MDAQRNYRKNDLSSVKKQSGKHPLSFQLQFNIRVWIIFNIEWHFQVIFLCMDRVEYCIYYLCLSCQNYPTLTFIKEKIYIMLNEILIIIINLEGSNLNAWLF